MKGKPKQIIPFQVPKLNDFLCTFSRPSVGGFAKGKPIQTSRVDMKNFHRIILWLTIPTQKFFPRAVKQRLHHRMVNVFVWGLSKQIKTQESRDYHCFWVVPSQGWAPVLNLVFVLPGLPAKGQDNSWRLNDAVWFKNVHPIY